MTRLQAISKIRQNLDDLGVTFYSVDDINESIQDAYDEIVVYTECLEKLTSLNWLSNYTYYDFSTLIPDYYRLVKIFNNNNNRFIEASNARYNTSYRQDWEITSGTPTDFTLLGPKLVGFAGRSANATGSFKVWYKAKAPTITNDNHVFLINDNFIELIEFYTTADLLEQNEEFSKAGAQWQQYDVMLEKYREKIQLLAKSDRVFTRNS